MQLTESRDMNSLCYDVVFMVERNTTARLRVFVGDYPLLYETFSGLRRALTPALGVTSLRALGSAPHPLKEALPHGLSTYEHVRVDNGIMHNRGMSARMQ